MQYSITLLKDTTGYLLISRDFPELTSVAETLEQVQQEALDALETVFMLYMEDRRAIPAPSAVQADEVLVNLPVRTAVKVALYNEMLVQKVTKAEMARRLGWNQVQADRLLSVRHSTKLDSIEAAFSAIGRHLDIAVV